MPELDVLAAKSTILAPILMSRACARGGSCRASSASAGQGFLETRHLPISRGQNFFAVGESGARQYKQWRGCVVGLYRPTAVICL